MENYAYSSYPESGESSPRSREIESETAVAAWDVDLIPPPSARVKLMCSYGGRIQPRSHDNQLSYVGGDTKILAVDRSVRYPFIMAKLAALCGSGDVLLKYQLPGEDLDALISVTNDEDLDHMMIEYDRLHRCGSKPVARLRLILFAAAGGGKATAQDRPWFADSPPLAASATAKEGPDFLFGLDQGFAPPPAVKGEDLEVETARSEQRLQIAENNNHQQQQKGSPADYYVTHVQEKPPAPAPATAATYWTDHHRSVDLAPRFASVAGGGEQQFYLIPANPGVYPAPGQGYYATVQRIVPAAAYDSAAAYYTMSPASPQPVKDAAVEASAAPPASMAYDSSGRAVYYAGGSSTSYKTVGGNVALAAESKVLKPSQVS